MMKEKYLTGLASFSLLLWLLLPLSAHAEGIPLAKPGGPPICPHILGWPEDVKEWAEGAPWIKALDVSSCLQAKERGARVFYCQVPPSAGFNHFSISKYSTSVPSGDPSLFLASDHRGKSSIASKTSEIYFAYDLANRVTQKWVWNDSAAHSGDQSLTIDYHYNTLHQLEKVTIDDASGCGCTDTKWYGYDDKGRMYEHTAVVQDTTMTYTYDDVTGALSEFEFPLLGSSYGLGYTYDVLGRPGGTGGKFQTL